MDATSKHLRVASLSGSRLVILTDVCVFVKRLGDLSQLNEVSLNNANSLTVKTCITACHAKNYTQCGVGNNKCCTCFTYLVEHSSTYGTSLLKTVVIVPSVEPR